MKNWIKELRESEGMTLQQLADATNTTHQQISLLEHGKRKLTWDWIVKISNALQCHPMDLIDGPALVKTPTEKELVDKYRHMSEHDRVRFVGMADMFLQIDKQLKPPTK